jgi:hypothetical protein
MFSLLAWFSCLQMAFTYLNILSLIILQASYLPRWIILISILLLEAPRHSLARLRWLPARNSVVPWNNYQSIAICVANQQTKWQSRDKILEMRLIVIIPEALFKMRVDACQFAHQNMIKYPFGLAVSKRSVYIYIFRT